MDEHISRCCKSSYNTQQIIQPEVGNFFPVTYNICNACKKKCELIRKEDHNLDQERKKKTERLEWELTNKRRSMLWEAALALAPDFYANPTRHKTSIDLIEVKILDSAERLLAEFDKRKE